MYFANGTRYNEGEHKNVKEGQAVNLVFSFDENYIDTFKVLLYSIYVNNPDEAITCYLLHHQMEQEHLKDLEEIMVSYQFKFEPIDCKDFLKESNEITINRYYTIEMYLWLFAPYVLPDKVERALYLDPDIINLNNIHRFYDLGFEDHLFIAMDYEIKNKIVQPINNLRLGTLKAEHYFNAGVVLMNIEKLRNERNAEEIPQAVVEHKDALILPDQDIFNYLYTQEIKNGEWKLHNMDPRLYQFYKTIMPDKYNLDWVDDEVVFIHYGGKHKPWEERAKYKMDLGHYYFTYEEQLKQKNIERGVT